MSDDDKKVDLPLPPEPIILIETFSRNKPEPPKPVKPPVDKDK